MKNKLLAAITLVFLLASSGTAQAADPAVEARIAKLEEEIKLLKRQLEVKEEVAQTKAQKTPDIELNKKGLVVASPDKNFTMNAHGYAQIDARSFFGDKETGAINNQGNGTDQIVARRIRPIVEGTLYKDWSYRFMPDFGQSTVRLADAYMDYHLYDELQFRAGKFKQPTGLERLQSDTDTFFIERGPVSNLNPDRDLGFEIFGNLIPDTLEYQVSVFNGNADLDNSDSDIDDNKDFAARIFAHPFHDSAITALQGFGAGIAGTFGTHEGTAANSGLTSGYKTPGQANFFTYTAGTFADGDNWRLFPQAYYYNDNMGLMAEYGVSSQAVRNGAATEDITNKAWQVAGSYVLTGEDVTFKGSIKPENNFDPLHGGGWGAFELVARVGETDIDDDAFPTFASPATSASEAFVMGVGLNWYLNENLKLWLDFENTRFDGGAAGGADRDDENVLLSRLQLRL